MRWPSTFLAGTPEQTFGSTATGIGSRLLKGPAAAEAVNGIARHWGETGRDVDADPIYRHVKAWIAGEQVSASRAEAQDARG